MNKYFRFILTLIVCCYFWHYASTYTDWHFIDWVNLIFHEAGHSIFFFMGEFIKILAGSGFQVALPLLISIYFFINKQKISGAICLLWVGQNLLNVSIYAGDAIVMQLPLLGGDNVIHDWNYILTNLGILKNTALVASVIYNVGMLFIIIGSILALYFSLTYKEKDKSLLWTTNNLPGGSL